MDADGRRTADFHAMRDDKQAQSRNNISYLSNRYLRIYVCITKKFVWSVNRKERINRPAFNMMVVTNFGLLTVLTEYT
jgi:hypothetical protein